MMTFYYQWAPKGHESGKILDRTVMWEVLYANDIPNKKIFQDINQGMGRIFPILDAIEQASEFQITFPKRILQNLIYPSIEKAYLPMRRGCVPTAFQLYQVCEIDTSSLDKIEEAPSRHVSLVNIYEPDMTGKILAQAYWLNNHVDESKTIEAFEIVTEKSIRFISTV
jgi:hypothetical protein